MPGRFWPPSWLSKAIKNRTCFEHFFGSLSGEVFESLGPLFRELWATILETFWYQRGKVKTVLSLQSEPSREGLRRSLFCHVFALESGPLPRHPLETIFLNFDLILVSLFDLSWTSKSITENRVLVKPCAMASVGRGPTTVQQGGPRPGYPHIYRYISATALLRRACRVAIPGALVAIC